VAIASMDQLIAGMIRYPRLMGKDSATAKAAGIQHTNWYQTGALGAGVAPTGALNGATFTGVTTGAPAVPLAVTSLTSNLAKWTGTQAGNIGGAWLIDKQWGNVPVVTTTGAQAIVSPTWVARDETASTNGVGVFLALECSATTGNAGAITNTTVSYTNSSGTAGRTATLASFPITGVTGTWVMFSMQAGDVGVRSVQSITLGTSYVSGQVHLVAFRLIAELGTPTNNVIADAAFTRLNMPVVVYEVVGTALGTWRSSVYFAQG